MTHATYFLLEGLEILFFLPSILLNLFMRLGPSVFNSFRAVFRQ